MEASRVIIGPDMEKSINDPRLSSSRKKELRIHHVINLINSRPVGTLFKKIELVRAAGFTTQNSRARGYLFIDSMIENGIINTNGEHKTKSSWYVIDTDKHKEHLNPSTQIPDVKTKVEINVQQHIETLAVDFAWNNNTDSLRDFIKYLKQERRI
jgi:hypothetical protein